jgi:hypothetical protein
MSYKTSINSQKAYKVLNPKNNYPLMYFRLQMSARRWVEKNQKNYLKELKIIRTYK